MSFIITIIPPEEDVQDLIKTLTPGFVDENTTDRAELAKSNLQSELNNRVVQYRKQNIVIDDPSIIVN